MEKNSKTCPYCGNKIKKLATKCRYCSNWLVESHHNIYEQNNSSKTQTMIGIRLLVLVFLGFGLGYAVFYYYTSDFHVDKTINTMLHDSNSSINTSLTNVTFEENDTFKISISLSYDEGQLMVKYILSGIDDRVFAGLNRAHLIDIYENVITIDLLNKNQDTIKSIDISLNEIQKNKEIVSSENHIISLSTSKYFYVERNIMKKVTDAKIRVSDIFLINREEAFNQAVSALIQRSW